MTALAPRRHPPILTAAPTPTPNNKNTVEIVVFVACVFVLGIAFVMFIRLFDALSPPTKALAWVVGADEMLAILLLAFMCFQQHFYVREEQIPQGTWFCHYCNPLVLALVVFGWLGQPVIAWCVIREEMQTPPYTPTPPCPRAHRLQTHPLQKPRRTTLKTLRNEAVPARKLRRIFYWCIAVALLDYVWGVAVTPGRIVNGTFCIMKANHPGQLDARIFANLIGIVTFVASVVLYCKSYRHLKRLQRKYVVGRGELHVVYAPAHVVSSVPNPQRDPIRFPSSSSNAPHTNTTHRLVKDLRKMQPPTGVAVDSDVVKEPSREASNLGPGSHVSHGNLSGDGVGGGVEVLVVEKGGRWEAEAEISDDEDDSSVDSEEDAPFTYEQLQARTLAARAAVNLLLPNRTDDMAGRDGPYGMRRAGRDRRCVRVWMCVWWVGD